MRWWRYFNNILLLLLLSAVVDGLCYQAVVVDAGELAGVLCTCWLDTVQSAIVNRKIREGAQEFIGRGEIRMRGNLLRFNRMVVWKRDEKGQRDPQNDMKRGWKVYWEVPWTIVYMLSVAFLYLSIDWLGFDGIQVNNYRLCNFVKMSHKSVWLWV